MTLTTTFQHIPSDIFAQRFKKTGNRGTKNTLDFQFPKIEFSTRPVVNNFGNRSRLTFKVLPEFDSSFVLIRGLIEFNRSRHLQFQFDLEQRNFEIELDTVRLPELVSLLQNINTQLHEELRFKAALKKAIEFEKHYRKACAQVYSFASLK
jgi:hypothetical protein